MTVAFVERARTRYDQLSSREQRTVLLGGVLFIVIALLGGVLTLEHRADLARQGLLQRQRDLAFVQAASAEILAAGPVSVGSSSDSLVVVADRAARAAGLVENLSGSESTSEGVLRTSFRGASFDALAGMVATLLQQAGVSVQAASIEPAAEPGRVNASLTLSRATAR
jgi:type II secretory pathway component PulM